MWAHAWNCVYIQEPKHTFFDNVKFMGDLPFSIYFDFETTSGKKVLMKTAPFIQFPMHLWLHFIRVLTLKKYLLLQVLITLLNN